MNKCPHCGQKLSQRLVVGGRDGLTAADLLVGKQALYVMPYYAGLKERQEFMQRVVASFNFCADMTLDELQGGQDDEPEEQEPTP